MYYKSRSKVKVKVTELKFMVSNESSGHEESLHVCDYQNPTPYSLKEGTFVNGQGH